MTSHIVDQIAYANQCALPKFDELREKRTSLRNRHLVRETF